MSDDWAKILETTYRGKPVTVNTTSTADRPDVMKQFLKQVEDAVTGPRQRAYGPPEKNHGCTAGLWNLYLQRKYDCDLTLDAVDVCMLNVLQKCSRLANKIDEDGFVDIAGYAANAVRILDAEF